MNPDRAALVRAVCTDPGDDTVRLVFADWLREHGEGERAALIQLQIERGGQTSAEWPRDGGVIPYDDWPDSASQIFATELQLPMRRLGFGFRWRRGFIDHVSLHTPTFLDRAEELFALHPVEGITLVGVRPDVHPRAVQGAEQLPRPDAHVLPHILVGVSTELDSLFGSRVPMPLWELLTNYEDVDYEPDQWPHKTYPSLAHALESLSRACVAWGRELAELPPWNPPYRLISRNGEEEAKAPPV